MPRDRSLQAGPCGLGSCSNTKEEYTIPFGACVWSTGVAMHPLLKQVRLRSVHHHAGSRSFAAPLPTWNTWMAV